MPSPMRVIYVIGPFRAETAWAIEQHVRRAESLALEVWRLGAVALCPHLNTRLFHKALPDEVWLTGDLELLRRCDGGILVEGWQRSQGSLAERDALHAQGKPVFESLAELETWLNA